MSPPNKLLELTVGPALKHLLSTGIVAFTVFAHYFLTHIAQQFEEVFAGFGADLPSYTQAFLTGSPVYFVLPTVCFVAYIAHWLNRRFSMPVLVACAIGTVLMYPAVTIAMYLPVFQLGAVVAG